MVKSGRRSRKFFRRRETVEIDEVVGIPLKDGECALERSATWENQGTSDLLATANLGVVAGMRVPLRSVQALVTGANTRW